MGYSQIPRQGPNNVQFCRKRNAIKLVVKTAQNLFAEIALAMTWDIFSGNLIDRYFFEYLSANYFDRLFRGKYRQEYSHKGGIFSISLFLPKQIFVT